jgi:hypothetical protein
MAERIPTCHPSRAAMALASPPNALAERRSPVACTKLQRGMRVDAIIRMLSTSPPIKSVTRSESTKRKAH